MSLRPDLLAALPGLVATRIHAALPGLRTAEGMVGGFDLDELKRAAIVTPAVLVTVLGVRQAGSEAGPRHRWAVSMAAFVVTKDAMGLRRDTAAQVITQSLLGLIPEANWLEPGVGPAREIEARIIVGRAAREIATHLSAVSWTQPLVFDALPGAAPIPLEIYVAGDPL